MKGLHESYFLNCMILKITHILTYILKIKNNMAVLRTCETGPILAVHL
jgi:hypothetical protein